MSHIREKLVEVAIREWEIFGKSYRGLDERWHIVGDEAKEPWTGIVNKYWRSVGLKDWDGNTKQPWSAAFISWCFRQAWPHFKGSPKHSAYIDHLRRDHLDKLTLEDPRHTVLRPGDLIWNARGKRQPHHMIEAVHRLAKGDFFDSHVDIVVSVGPGSCDSIGGNVSNRDPGGSVTRSTWRLSNGRLLDSRKNWIGVVKNGL